jgi:hypothetical protein
MSSPLLSFEPRARAVGGCVIIDDRVDMAVLRTHLVLTHPAHGLQPDDVPRVFPMLSSSPRIATEDRSKH